MRVIDSGKACGLQGGRAIAVAIRFVRIGDGLADQIQGDLGAAGLAGEREK